MLYVGNAFSLQMLDVKDKCAVGIDKLTKQNAKKILKLYEKELKSVIGHQDLANILKEELEMDFEVNRESIKLTLKDMLLVAQVVGGRLPEGTTKLPEGVKIEYYLVYLM